MKERSDSELVAEFKASGDPACVGELFSRYHGLTSVLCMKILKDPDKVQDAMMDVYERVINKLPTHNVTNFSAWVYSIARNHCLNLVTRNKEVRLDPDNHKIPGEDFMENENALGQIIEREENLTDLEDCVEQLKDEQKTCIKLFFLQQLSYNQIVEKTTFNMKKVKSFIQNGKRNLRICIERKQDERGES